MTDAEIIAREHSIYRARVRAGLAITAAMMVLALGIAVAGQLGWLGGALPTRWAIVIPLLFLLPALALMWFYRAPKEARRDSVLRRQIDTYQTRHNLSSVILLLSALLIASRLAVAPHPSFALMAIFVVMIGIFCAMVCFGPGYANKATRDALDDELLRSMRSRAARVGYVSMVVLVAAAYLTIAFKPALALTILPFLLFAGAAIPTLYLVFLHWNALRDG